MTALLLERDPFLAERISSLLREAGFNVTVVRNVGQAMMSWGASSPDVTVVGESSGEVPAGWFATAAGNVNGTKVVRLIGESRAVPELAAMAVLGRA